MPINCPNCGKETEDSVLFCQGCGKPVSEGHAADDLIGREILGTYQLVELLGEGGMSVVYRARHVLTDQEVAVKVLPPELSTQKEVKARFIEEARTLARLEHPNIVVLHNFIESEGFLYLVMQCAEGETFDATIEREGRIEVGEAVSIVVEVLRALEYAHDQGVIHRDIKPSNIILRGDGAVKVMDFGIAKFTGSSKLTQTGQTMGTVRYMSPEQVRGKQIDHRTDLYSLGIALYEALTGRTPFDGETHFEIMQKHLTEQPDPPGKIVALPPELEEVVLRSLAKKVDQRFQTAREFRHALQRLPLQIPGRKNTSSIDIPSVVTSKVEHKIRRPAVRLFPILAAGMLILLSGSAVLWAILDSRGQPSSQMVSDAKNAGESPPKITAAKWPEVHRVAQRLQWKATRKFDNPVGLNVMSTTEIDFNAIKELYVKARDAYQVFLKEEGMDLQFTVGPLHLAIVEQRMLNNKEYWPDVKPNVDYPTRYMAPTATLFVNNAKGYRQKDLPFGLALHFCARIAQLSNQRCLDLAEGFEHYLRRIN